MTSGLLPIVADRIAVLYAGKIVEEGTRREIILYPSASLYKGPPPFSTQARSRRGGFDSIPGSPPDLFAPPAGCPFAARCDMAMEECDRIHPQKTQPSEDHHVDCWLQDDRAKQAMLSAVNVTIR